MNEFNVDEAREFLEALKNEDPSPRNTMKRAVMELWPVISGWWTGDTPGSRCMIFWARALISGSLMAPSDRTCTRQKGKGRQGEGMMAETVNHELVEKFVDFINAPDEVVARGLISPDIDRPVIFKLEKTDIQYMPNNGPERL